MAEHAQPTVQHAERATTTAEQAEALEGGALLPAHPVYQPGLLARADGPTRARLMRSLQRTHGNAHVQRLARQAAPTGSGAERGGTAEAAGPVETAAPAEATAPTETGPEAPRRSATADLWLPPGVQRSPETGVVQRGSSDPLLKGVKLPISYQYDIPVNKGKYVKLTKVSFKAEGTYSSMEKSGTPTGTVGGGQQSDKKGSKDVMVVAVEKKKEAEGMIADEIKAIGGGLVKSTEKSLFEGKMANNGDLQGKVAYEYGVEAKLIKGAKISFTPEFTVFGLIKKASKAPEFKVLVFTPKVNLELGPVENFLMDGFQLNGKVTAQAEIEPDWSSLAILALETPAGWVLAGAAAAALLVGYSYKSAIRQAQLANQVRAQTRQIIQSAVAYGGEISGQTKPASGELADKAKGQAGTDLSAILGRSNPVLNTNEYMDLMKLQGLQNQFFGKAQSDYQQKALAIYRAETMEKLKAWHADNFWHDFFAGKYLSDDEALMDSIMDTEVANGGHPTIG